VTRAWLAACVVACSPQTQADAAKAAECDGIRSFYDLAQTRLLEEEICGDTPAPQCPAHIVMREALIATLKERRCPGSSKPQ
jgi:hypothetical protein